MLRRSAELTLGQQRSWFMVTSATRSDHVFVDLTPDGSRRMKYSGDYDRWRTYWRLFRYRFGLEGLPGDPLWVAERKPSQSRRREITAEIVMGNGSAPAGAFNASVMLKGA